MSFETQVEGITQIAISSSGTAPTQNELSEFLVDGAIDIINKVSILKPHDIYKFSTQSIDNDNSGVSINGNVLNVMRANENTTDLRMASPIDAGQRFLATQKSSLYYRSALNPAYYVLNGKLFVIPSPGSSSTAVYISHINFPTGIVYSDSSIGIDYKVQTGVTATAATPTVLTKASHGFSDGDIVKLFGFTEATELNGITAIVESSATNTFQLDGVYVDGDAETTGGTVERLGGGFPTEYTRLVILYASAMSCMAAASEIQNNMPTKVTKLNSPVFNIDDISLPSAPNYIVPSLEFDLSKVNTNLKNEDMEMAEKEMEKLTKNVEKTKLLGEEAMKVYGKELEIYKTTIDNATKNADRDTQLKASEYRSELYKHQQEVAQYTGELQESMAKYKWYIEQYITLLTQYNSQLGVSAPRAKQEGEG